MEHAAGCTPRRRADRRRERPLSAQPRIGGRGFPSLSDREGSRDIARPREARLLCPGRISGTPSDAQIHLQHVFGSRPARRVRYRRFYSTINWGPCTHRLAPGRSWPPKRVSSLARSFSPQVIQNKEPRPETSVKKLQSHSDSLRPSVRPDSSAKFGL